MRVSTRIAVLLMAVFFLCACNPDGISEKVRVDKAIPESKKEAAASWILEAINAINPHSDGEPEYTIRQAEKTAIELFGVQTVGIFMYDYGYHEFIPYENCNRRQKRLINKWKNEGYER